MLLRDLRCLAALILLLVMPATAGAAPPPAAAAPRLHGVTIEPRPAWVDPPPAPATRVPIASEGVAALVLDRQTRHLAGARWQYLAAAFQVVSEVGAGTIGERGFEFVPPHERLVLHTLVIRRGGEVLPRLSLDRIRLLERETGLERSEYTGAKTAVIVVPGLRVGDILEYEYSIVGSNPVLAGHVSDRWHQEMPFPVGVLRHRLVADHPLFAKGFGGADVPAIVERGGLLEARWEGRDVEAFTLEDRAPIEDDEFPWVQLTDFASWQRVAWWGRALFPPQREGLEAAIAEIEAHSGDGPRALAALRKVQDEVRYLSLSLAESSHRPAPPREVLERRHGDCKDKSLLLVSLLQAVGIDAHVALVSSSGGRKLPELLPSIAAFDHAIVVAQIDGQRRWLDPTRGHQRGQLDDVSPRGFAHALILGPSADELVPVDEPSKGADVFARLRYVIEAWGGPIELHVTTKFGNANAESMRAMRASLSEDEFARRVAELSTPGQAEATRVGATSYRDDETYNLVEVSQQFDLGTAAWTHDGGRAELAIFPPYLSEIVPTVRAERRQAIALVHPLRIVHEMTIVTPEEIALKPSSGSWANLQVEHTWKTERVGREVRHHSTYVTLSRRVEAANLGALREISDAVSSQAQFSVWRQLEAPPGASTFPLAAFWIVLAIWTVAVIAVVAVVHRARPWLRRRSVPFVPSLVGRSGWLIIVGLGVTLFPVSVVVVLVQAGTLLTPTTWAVLTTPGSESYSPGWAPAMLVEVCGNVTLLVVSTWVAILFWMTSRTFPLGYVIAFGVSAVTFAVNLAIAHAVDLPGAGETVGEEIRNLFVRGGWTAYVLLSKRVRSTFLPPPIEERDDGQAAERDGRPPRRRRRRRPIAEDEG